MTITRCVAITSAFFVARSPADLNVNSLNSEPKKKLGKRDRLSTIFSIAILFFGFIFNLVYSPQIYVARPPVFNGVDIASTWEWRSMAIREHSWWLWSVFPDAHVSHVGFVRRSSGELPVGIRFSSWRDEYLGLDVEESETPLDVTDLDVRQALLSEARVFSRIHCRDNQAMTVRDTCFYFVAWSDDLLPETNPEFIAVRTNLDEDSEVALVEKTFLASVLPVSIDQIPDYFEVDQ